MNSVRRVTAFTLGFHMPPKYNTRCVIVPPEQLILEGRPENPPWYSASFQKPWGNQVAQALGAWTLSVLGRSVGTEIPPVTLAYRAQEFCPAELLISQGKYLETYPALPSDLQVQGLDLFFQMQEGRSQPAGATPRLRFPLTSSNKSSLTPLLHEDEEVVQELLPFRVAIQFIKLEGENKNKGTVHKETDEVTALACSSRSSGVCTGGKKGKEAK